MRNCPSCASRVSPQARFCDECGADLTTLDVKDAQPSGIGPRFCRNCGNALSADARFCAKCGMEPGQYRPARPGRRPPIIAAVLLVVVVAAGLGGWQFWRHHARQPTTQPKAPTPARVTDQEVGDFLDRWSSAQNARVFAGYAACYGPAFTGVKRTLSGRVYQLNSRSDWLADRQKMMARAAWVSVSVQNRAIEPATDDNETTVRFTQVYRSDLYSDTGEKVMRLRRDSSGGGLSIVREDLQSCGDAPFDPEEIRQIVYAWRDAWQNRNADRQMLYYSRQVIMENYAPRREVSDFNSLYDRKRRLFRQYSNIQVGIANLRVVQTPDGAKAQFVQTFRGYEPGESQPHYQSTGDESLWFRKENGSWRIYREEFRKY